VEVVLVGHNGMAPSMLMGDRVLVWKTQDLELGEPVLCEHPEQRGRYVLGRIVGRPGHTVTLERGVLRIDGDAPDREMQGTFVLDDRELGRHVTMQWAIEDILDHDHYVAWREGNPPEISRPVRVTRGYFLLGDNLSHRGEDSRSFGTVDESRCVGRVFMRLSASAASPEEVGNAALDLIE
jgi:signal peptidase I